MGDTVNQAGALVYASVRWGPKCGFYGVQPRWMVEIKLYSMGLWGNMTEGCRGKRVDRRFAATLHGCVIELIKEPRIY